MFWLARLSVRARSRVRAAVYFHDWARLARRSAIAAAAAAVVIATAAAAASASPRPTVS